MAKGRVSLLAVLSIVAALTGAARGADSDAGTRPLATLEAALGRALPSLLDRYRVPGASIAVLHRGRVAWEHAAGVADRRSRLALSPEASFQVASLSKPVAALGVLLLAEEGRIDLDRPVWDYIESWRPPPSPYDLDGVTARRLLSHRGGVGLHGYPGVVPEQPLPTLLASLGGETAGAGRVELVSEPGARALYSSGGYTILQLLIEESSGEPFASFMARRVLGPLGMTRSSFEPGGAVAAAATGHGWWGGPLPAYRFREQASSGLRSTAGDLARFLTVLSSPEAQAAVGISAAMVESMLRPPEGGGYALGFAVEPPPTRLPTGQPVPPLRIVSHTGANRGFRSILAVAPDRGDGFVALTNSDRALAMTSDLLCVWGRWVSDVELASCWAEGRRRGTLLAVAGMIGLGVLMDGGALVERLRRARIEPRPRWAPGPRHGWTGWPRASFSIVLLAGWWLFWYSDEVAIRREGIAHFVPASSLPPTFFWLTAVLSAWCLLGIARWLVVARPDRRGAAG